MVKRRVLLSLLGLCLVLAFVALGRWQLGRAHEKEAMLAAAASVSAGPANPLSGALGADAGRIDKVAGDGRFLDTPPLWLDNQRRGERVGVRLYCAFAPTGGGALLVDLGWLPLPADRTLPAEACPAGEYALSGLLVAPPAPGLAMGAGLESRDGDQRWLALRVEPAAVAAAWSLPALDARVLRLDPSLPLGHERDLELLANTLTPDKHRGYALQWFGLALAALVFAALPWFRKRP